MKKMVWCLAAFVAAFAQADTLDLSTASIRRAAKENPQQKRAFDELERHLKLVTETKIVEQGAFEFVFARPEGEPPPAPYSWHAKRVGSVVWFWGDDKGLRRQPFPGSLFAVYEFFEHALGVRWVGSEDDDIVFKPGRKAELPENWRKDRVYDFVTALIRGMPAEYGYRMRYAEKRPFKYGHAFRDWQRRYLKEHPEYFCLNPYGTRGLPDKHAWMVKLCLSNEATVDRIVGNWQAAGAPPYLNVCPNDGTPGYCFCEGCLKLDADLPGENFYYHKTDRYLNFWNRIAAKVRKIRPDAKLVSYIYSYYVHPPRRERIEYPDNIIFGIVPAATDDYLDDLKKWKEAGLRHFFLRPNFVCYRGALPWGRERFVYDSYHQYLEAGSVGFDYDGALRPILSLEYYVLMRMIDRPEMPLDAIVDEFCSQYGAAAGVAKQYFTRLRERADKGLVKTKEELRRKRISLLDDSGLSEFSVNGHTAKDLEDDLALLKSVSTAELSPVELRRWQTLVKRAEGYPAAFELAKQVKLVERPIGPEGWLASFDVPSYQSWEVRDLKAKLTNKEASFDRWSVEFETKPTRQIALWRRNVPVTSGAKYSLSFDVKFDEGVESAGMRVVAEGKNRRDLAKKFVKRNSAYWHIGAVEFEVPEDVKNLTLYFSVGPGGEGRRAWLDNVCLKRHDPDKGGGGVLTAALNGAVVDTNGVKWIDGKLLPLEGRAFSNVDDWYDRLPSDLTTNVNKAVHGLKHHTSGMQFRFSTDSRTLRFKWVPYYPYLNMDHMPSTGVSGIDVYRYDAKKGGWCYVKTGRITNPNGAELSIPWEPGEKCIVNLPLYNGIKSFKLGIDGGAKLYSLGSRKSGIDKPVVFYGTSITQGGCCSRPGLAFPNIVGRKLDVPIVGLGFSGSGVMELEMSEHLARIDASCYVLDCVPNMGAIGGPVRPGRMVEENYEPFIRNLRAKRPNVPIVMAEECDVFQRGRGAKDEFVRKLYAKLKAEGWKKLVYLPKDGMFSGDLEGTVDARHPNDLGMVTMANAFGGAIKAALGL